LLSHKDLKYFKRIEAPLFWQLRAAALFAASMDPDMGNFYDESFKIAYNKYGREQYYIEQALHDAHMGDNSL
jgi:hypothetical protein